MQEQLRVEQVGGSAGVADSAKGSEVVVYEKRKNDGMPLKGVACVRMCGCLRRMCVPVCRGT